MNLRVVIAACTYRRPDGLDALLRSIAELEVPGNVDLRILIVDNDKKGEARPIVSDWAERLPIPVDYAIEVEPGIPFARNCVLDTSKDADLLLFVDDDETVSPQLLCEHLRIRDKTRATFVQGPCEKTVEDSADRWWLDTIFFRDRDFADAAPRSESWTNNVLIDLDFLRRTGLRFDEALRFSGGTDTLFFQDIVRNGGTGAYAAHALVYEVQPKSRLTWRWALARQYRYGVTRANTRLLRQGRLSATLYCAGRSAGMTVFGLAHVLSATLRGRRGAADGTALLARGAGVALGAIGFRAEEYQRS